jgi:TetR/AcrR family transcriptional repressor of nem operon
MARPRKFNSNDAIDGALDIFWRRGYSGTNLPELLKAMGLTRGSFYAAYTDKYNTFIQALKWYEDEYLSQVLGQLSECGSMPVAQQIHILFDQIDTDGSPKDRKGCVICNAMVEFGSTDEEIAAAVVRMSGAIVSALTSVLENHGEDHKTAQKNATALLQLYFGAQTLSKSGSNEVDFLETIKSIIA